MKNNFVFQLQNLPSCFQNKINKKKTKKRLEFTQFWLCFTGGRCVAHVE